MTVLSSPLMHRHDRLSAGTYARVYWSFDPATGRWSMVTSRPLVPLLAGELVDEDGDGDYSLELVGAVVTAAPRLSAARTPSGDTLFY